MADPVTALPEESLELPASPRPRALRLLCRPDFRNLFLAVSASELGDSLHYIALMWVVLEPGGPLGVVAVRLADSRRPCSSAFTAGSSRTGAGAALVVSARRAA